MTVPRHLAAWKPRRGSILPVQKRKLMCLGRARHSPLLVRSFHSSSRHCLITGTNNHWETVIAKNPQKGCGFGIGLWEGWRSRGMLSVFLSPWEIHGVKKFPDKKYVCIFSFVATPVAGCLPGSTGSLSAEEGLSHTDCWWQRWWHAALSLSCR